jgi:hypothetical protein
VNPALCIQGDTLIALILISFSGAMFVLLCLTEARKAPLALKQWPLAADGMSYLECLGSVAGLRLSIGT